MEWEEKVQNQLQVIDEKMDNLEQQIEETIEKGIELSVEPIVEIPTAVLGMTAGTALTLVGKNAISKENTISKNLLAGAAVIVGSATFAASAAKLAINCMKMKRAMDTEARPRCVRLTDDEA